MTKRPLYRYGLYSLYVIKILWKCPIYMAESMLSCKIFYFSKKKLGIFLAVMTENRNFATCFS